MVQIYHQLCVKDGEDLSTPPTTSSNSSSSRVDPLPPPLQARLLLTVHDEVVLEVPASQVSGVSSAVRGIMEGVVPPGGWPQGQGVPLKVDAKAGADWLQCG